MAVLYNVLFVVVRAVFWELNDLTWAWYVCDYICDFVYLVDIVVHMHEDRLISSAKHDIGEKCTPHMRGLTHISLMRKQRRMRLDTRLYY
ncbi:jg3157 [Pararge aegeria aegeria]|uniref:Jg3157 protein n=1 Tax=Pararge aegeria aegeria TaxID=348720 RepID=A0A8S4QEJ4_9NEOP|nr:jg3157 [Pararge aegeria aegeria]